MVELDSRDSIFHTIYDLDECPARWYGVYDDRGRVMVATSFNSDPHYLEKSSALGIRIR